MKAAKSIRFLKEHKLFDELILSIHFIVWNKNTHVNTIIATVDIVQKLWSSKSKVKYSEIKITSYINKFDLKLCLFIKKLNSGVTEGTVVMCLLYIILYSSFQHINNKKKHHLLYFLLG